MSRNCTCDNCEYRTNRPDVDCGYGSRCSNAKCCWAHPSPAGAREKAGGKATACRYSINCKRGTCEYAHPSPALKCCARGGGGASSEQSLVPSFAGMSLASSGNRAEQRLVGSCVKTPKMLEAIRKLKDAVDFMEEAGFRREDANAVELGSAHSMFMNELFQKNGCWTGNFSTSILEAKAKRIIGEEQVNFLVRFNAVFNQQARHPGPAKPPAPILSKTHQEWRRSPEFNQYFAGGAARITEWQQSSESNSDDDSDSDSDDNLDWWVCDQCQKEFGTERSLEQHRGAKGH